MLRALAVSRMLYRQHVVFWSDDRVHLNCCSGCLGCQRYVPADIAGSAKGHRWHSELRFLGVFSQTCRFTAAARQPQTLSKCLIRLRLGDRILSISANNRAEIESGSPAPSTAAANNTPRTPDPPTTSSKLLPTPSTRARAAQESDLRPHPRSRSNSAMENPEHFRSENSQHSAQ
jgi:hypothetical protein